jgi:flagellar FliL protein
MAEETNAQQETQPKKSFARFMILGLVVVVLGAGGFFGWNQLKGKESEAETKVVASKQEKQEVRIVFPLECFVVNLLDRAGSGKRYLKIALAVEVRDEEKKKIVERYNAELRDTILLLLSSQSYSEIITMDGKLLLKQALLARMNHALGGPVVQRIYFTEFVVQ